MVAVDAAQQEWLSSQDCGSAGLGVGTNRKLKTFQFCMFILGMACSYMILPSQLHPTRVLYDFKDALSQVVVEYDEEIPYDQDLAIRYSPFPIHQLCPFVARRAHGPGAS